MPAWTRDSGTMARLNAGQPVRIIAIGSFWCQAASGGPVDRHRGRSSSVVRPLLLHYHGSADLDAIIEVDHVLIGQADAARRHRRAD